MNATIPELMAAIAKGKGAKFVSFTYRAKESNELARHTLILGFNDEVLYRKDVEALQIYLLDAQGLQKTAAMELLESRKESLEKGIGNNSQYTCAGVFTEIFAGIKIHIVDHSLHVCGLVESKVVLEKGEFKKVNSSAKTIAKNEIRRDLPSGRFRQFRLDHVVSAKINGETLELEM